MQIILKPLFNSMKPEYIKYADSVSKLNTYQIIDTDEFAISSNFIWTESPLLTEDSYDFIADETCFDKLEEFVLKQMFKDLIIKAVADKLTMSGTIADYDLDRLMQVYEYCYAVSSREKLIELKNQLSITQEKLTKHLATPRKDLVIVKINSDLGYGLFLDPAAKAIEANEIVAIYTGCYKNFADRREHEDYAFDLPQHFIFSANNQLNSGFIDAKHYGNISRFIQDLPTQEELKELYKLPAKKKVRTATANIKGVLTYYQNVPLIYLIATRKIQPGEQLGFSYGKGYWTRAELVKNVKRFLFDIDGQLIRPDKFINYINFVKDNHYYCFSKNELKQIIKNNVPLNFVSNINGIAKNITVSSEELCLLYKKRFMVFKRFLKKITKF